MEGTTNLSYYDGNMNHESYHQIEILRWVWMEMALYSAAFFLIGVHYEEQMAWESQFSINNLAAVGIPGTGLTPSDGDNVSTID